MEPTGGEDCYYSALGNSIAHAYDGQRVLIGSILDYEANTLLVGSVSIYEDSGADCD